MPWTDTKQVKSRLEAVSKLLAALLRLHTQQQTVRVLGQVGMLKKAKLP